MRGATGRRGARRARPLSLLGLAGVLALLAACTPPAEPLLRFPPADGPPVVTDAANDLRGPLRVRGADLVDSSGRTVLIHGVNSVAKSPPFITKVVDGRLAGVELTELVRRGYNGIRLGVWPAALMPTPGTVDTAYLDEVERTVQALEDAGMWVLLDLHQDVFWGMPDWATPADAANLSERPSPGFEVIGWAAAYTSPKSLRQWDAWWHNEPVAPGLGVVDAYAVGVRALAERLRDASNIAGLELLNEPFPGSPVISCVVGGCPWLDALVTARSTELTNAVRAVAPRMPVWWEAQSLATMYSLPSMTTAGVQPGPDGRAVGLSFHTYCWDTDGGRVEEVPPGGILWCGSNFARAFENADLVARDWGAPRFLTEFGASQNPYNATVPARLADEQLVSWLHWSIGTYPDEVEVHLQRAYAQSVAGTPTFQRFDPATGAFTLRFRPSPTAAGPTVVAVPPRAYPAGYDVTVVGGSVSSAAQSGRLEVTADGTTDEVVVGLRRR